MSDQFVKEGELIEAGRIKPGHIIKQEVNENKYEFVKVTKVSRCKTGKHGSAKVMIEGNEVSTKTFRKVVLTGNQRVKLVEYKRVVYEILEYVSEWDSFIFYSTQIPGDNSREVPATSLDEETYKKLKQTWENFESKPKEPVNGEPARCMIKLVAWEDNSLTLDE